MKGKRNQGLTVKAQRQFEGWQKVVQMGVKSNVLNELLST